MKTFAILLKSQTNICKESAQKVLLHIYFIFQELRRDQWEQHCKGGGIRAICQSLLVIFASHQNINLEMICHHTSLLWFATPTEVMRRVGNVWVIHVTSKNNGWRAVLRIRDPGLFDTWIWDPGWAKNHDPNSDPGWTTWNIFPRA